MNELIKKVFPKSSDSNYKDSKIAVTVFLLIALIGTVISCIHFFAPDGGAGSIAA